MRYIMFDFALTILLDIIGVVAIGAGTVINLRSFLISKEEALRLARIQDDPSVIAQFLLRITREVRIALPLVIFGIGLEVFDIIAELLIV